MLASIQAGPRVRKGRQKLPGRDGRMRCDLVARRLGCFATEGAEGDEVAEMMKRGIAGRRSPVTHLLPSDLCDLVCLRALRRAKDLTLLLAPELL